MATEPDTISPVNPLVDHLGYQLRRASSLVMAMLAERLTALDLTVVETSFLILVARNPGIRQSDVGRLLSIKRANVAPLTSSLEHRGLVARTLPAARMSGLSATSAGAELADRAEAVMRENDRIVFERIAPLHRRNLHEACEAVWQADV
jgi:DNA-binding MarR family transcriptional regulator